MKILPEKAHYSPKEIAEYFDIAESALRLKIQEGKIDAIHPAGMKCLRIPREEVEKMKVPATE
jgi:excisionase family DNA binding protein